MAPNALALLLTLDPQLVEDVRAACIALGYRLHVATSAFEAEKFIVDAKPSLVFTSLHCQEGEGLGADFAKSVRESMGAETFLVGLLKPEEEKGEPFSRSGIQAVHRLPLIFPQFAKDLQFGLDEFFSK